MSTNSDTSRRFAARWLAAAAVAVLVAANPAAVRSDPARDAVVSFDPTSLPQTADAVDGWYDHGWTQQQLRGTAGGWFIQRKTGVRFATGTGTGPTVTETSTGDPPAHWRRLMNEVP